MREKFRELELTLEGQEYQSVESHVRYPLYTDKFEDALRTIFLDVLRKKEFESENEKQRFGELFGETENIIAFLGERGSGKTTAMEEFCRILVSLSDQRELEWWLQHTIPEKNIQTQLEHEKFFFHVFPRIDASMLENKEDLFEMIMSNLFKFFQCRVKNGYGVEQYGKGCYDEIIELFEDILSGYYAIRDSREEEYVGSYISKIQHVSLSLELQEKIDRLIGKIFREDYMSSRSCYLVIVLDDLDLNIEHGFDMLKQLQKYFASPHIIITFSADYAQLNEICWVHFMKAFSSEKSHVIEEKVEDKCRELGKDYIGKALPISKRMHMPNLNSDTRSVFVLDPSNKNGDTVKQYVMKTIARKMKIYYDINGKKRHYIEPDNIRGLVNYHRLLEELYEIDFDAWEQSGMDSEESKTFMEQYDQNHERINMDIANRMANKFLSNDQKKEFDQWLQIRLERRPESASFFMGQMSDRSNADSEEWTEMELFLNESEHRKNEYAQNDSNKDYSYGELLQRIYEYGRAKPQNKAYVKCLLASLTSEMVREKICFSKNPNTKRREEAKYILLELAGKSFGNVWLGEMMPIKRRDRYEKRNLGFQTVTGGEGMSRVICQIPADIFGTNEKKTQQEIEQVVRTIEDILDEKNFVRSMEWLLSFLNLPIKEGFPIKLHIGVVENVASKTEDEEKYVLQLEFKNMNIKYGISEFENINIKCGILEFIPKTLAFSEYQEMFYDFLSQTLTDAVVDKLGAIATEEKKKIRQDFRSWIKKKSFFARNKKDIAPIFPFYQVDFAYNILKRTRRELIEDNPETCEKYEWISYVKKVYKKLIEKMEDEEKEYKDIGIELNYSERFAEFPIVKALLGKGELPIQKEIVDLATGLFYGEDTGITSDTYIEGE